MSESLPDVPVIAGDWSDDDGQVFADLLVETSNAPAPVPTVAVVESTERPVRPGRLLPGTSVIDPVWTTPYQLVPADPNRTSLVIQNNSSTATDAIRIGGEASDLSNNLTSGAVYPANPLTLRGYTGPIYVSASGAGGPVPVSFWSVTS